MAEDEISMGGGSTVSQWSASFQAHFPWLPPLAAASPDSAAAANKKEEQEKELDIVACLYGNDEAVDLWELRELALSKGGLLSPHLRKRAWPKLVGAHEHVLHHATVRSLRSSSVAEQVGISKSDVNMLKRDVAESVWNVEEHVLSSRCQEQAKNMWAAKRARRVTFVPGLARVSSEKSSEEESAPPVGSIHMETTAIEEDESGTFSPGSQVTLDFSSKASTHTRASRQEQKILFNTVVSVLRTPPKNAIMEEDDRYYYHHGLHDVTALLLINLESPSLTNLVLRRLAAYSLRDALRNPRARSIEQLIDATLFALLKRVDPALHQHVTSCVQIPSFCLSWVQCWFARDLRDARAASRVFDVFLASHALMPIYLSVAMMCHSDHRRRILHTACNIKDMHSILRNLPKDMIQSNGDTELAMDTLEDIIQSAIGYMRSYPPHKLVPKPPPALAAFQEAPEWSVASVVPTDYALLQYAKKLRKGETTSPMPKLSNVRSSGRLCPLAKAASGIPQQRSVVTLMTTLFIGATLLFVALSGLAVMLEGLNQHPSSSFLTLSSSRAPNEICRATRPMHRPQAGTLGRPGPFGRATVVGTASSTPTSSTSAPTSSSSLSAISAALATTTLYQIKAALVFVENSPVARLLSDPRVAETVKHWWETIRSLSGNFLHAVKKSFLPKPEKKLNQGRKYSVKFGEFLI